MSLAWKIGSGGTELPVTIGMQIDVWCLLGKMLKEKKKAPDKGCIQWHLICFPTLSFDEIIWPTNSFYKWGNRGPSWKMFCSRIQNKSSSGPSRSRPLILSAVVLPPLLGLAFSRLAAHGEAFPCFLICCSFTAPHQGMSAQGYSLLSMGKLSPCKTSISSKTRCSWAVTKATKCWRYRVLLGSQSH